MNDLGLLIFYWGTLFFGILGGLFVLLTVWLAPFGGLISAVLAYRRGSDAWLYYGLIGSLYTVCLLLPWVYLTWRLMGRRVPFQAIVAGYVGAYLPWGITWFTFVIHSPTEWRLYIIGSAALVVVTSIALWLRMQGANRKSQPDDVNRSYRHRLEDTVYVGPFMLASGQMALLFVALRNEWI